MKRILYETQLSSKDPHTYSEVIKKVCREFSKIYDSLQCSADIATKVHKIAYETLNDRDPYAGLKKQSNIVAQSLLAKTDDLITSSNDPLRASVICAIVGNVLDFGIEGSSTHPEKLLETFDTIFKEGLGYDEYPRFKQLVKRATQVVFFADNCGEIVFDKLLCREIKRFNPNVVLTLVVKKVPILSDATLEDATAFHFDEVVDDIQTTGSFAVGVQITALSKGMKNLLDSTDLIICKGMANYESFSETSYRPIAYLLKIKCNAIARSLNIPLHVNAVKVIE